MSTPAPARVRLRDRLPLRTQLVSVVVVVAALGIAVSGATGTFALRSYLMSRVDHELAGALAHEVTTLPAQAGLTAPVALPSPAPPGDRDPEAGVAGQGPATGGQLGGQGTRPAAYYSQLNSAAGVPIHTDTSLTGTTVPPTLHTTAAQATATAGQPFTQDGWRVKAGVRVINGVQYVVLVASDLSEIENTLARLALIEVVAGLAVLAVVGLLAWLLVRTALAPLLDVETTAEAIAGGDLARRVPTGDPRTEVGGLAQALNTMLSQIEAAFDDRAASEEAARTSEGRMRRFVADASHELRTPLTSIRGFAELYRQGAVREPDQVSRAMGRIEDEAARMGLLVDDLLLLARMDQQRPLEHEPVDLLRLAADTVTDAHATQPGRPVRLEATGGAPVVIGDEARLRQVLANLMSNALVHTPADTAVTVRVGHDETTAVVEVADEGPGMTAEAAAQVFDRFYRAEDSRVRSAGGSGLGLSIVDALVTAQAGSVSVTTAPGQGAVFTVRLPLALVPDDEEETEAAATPHPPLGNAVGETERV